MLSARLLHDTPIFLGAVLLLGGCTRSQSALSSTALATANNSNTVLISQSSTRFDSANTLFVFDQPLGFVYGSWDKNARLENKVLVVSSPNGQGGLGLNTTFNLASKSDLSPVLRLKIGPNNKAKALRLRLNDAKGGSAMWEFPIANVPVGQTTEVFPQDGAPLSTPTEIAAEGRPNLAAISQWQLQGNWGSEAVDVSIESVALLPPTPAVLAERKKREVQLQAEAQKLREEQLAQQKQYPRSDKSPSIINVSRVASNIVVLEIQAGRVVPGSLVPYSTQAGDEKREKKLENGTIESVTLVRGGKEIGFLVGTKRNFLNVWEGFQGDPLLEWLADDIKNFSVSVKGQTAVKPVAVWRKSKPNDWAKPIDQFAIRHTLYLQMPKPLLAATRYTVSVGALNTRQASLDFETEADKSRSEAVHVSQIGYRPDDPAKRAFVSCWMGTGGALKLPDTVKFSVVDDKTGKIEYSNSSSDIWRADKVEKMQTDRNFNSTDVARLDFSSFTKPGKYRVVVDGIGSSYPFEIGADVWRRAFLIQMKGLYNQRSGMELGPPYTTFKKPRDMNPVDGYPVTKTSYRSVESGGEAWDKIVAGDTKKKADGWGGYHDAGDWNPRRVTHMKVTMAQLEVLEMFPQAFSTLKLNIPPRAGTPDMLTEALWEWECFERLQQSDGGVPYGIESGLGDPAAGETSWLNSFPSYVFTADYLNSWYYAAVGARLSSALAPYDAKRAAVIRQNAIRAFEWAERDFAKDKAAGLTAKRENTWEALDYRNLAALLLYRLTREAKWNTRFLENTVLTQAKPNLYQWTVASQREHAFIYATLPKGLGDENLKKKAVAAIEAMAERSLQYASDNAWNLTSPDKGKPQFIGFYSTPDAMDLTRAHFLTKKSKYLAGAVQATQFQSGSNPNNLVYTTGLGVNPVKNPFKMDARRTGQPVPVGLTPYGNVDLGKWGDQGWITWPITYYLNKSTTPNPYSWPTTEAYWDIGQWPALNEYTVDTWAPNIAVWGYLAARAPVAATAVAKTVVAKSNVARPAL